jgi:hypothetical protein
LAWRDPPWRLAHDGGQAAATLSSYQQERKRAKDISGF